MPIPQPVLSELTSLSFNFFWAGKKDLVARRVLFHPCESGGFSLVSIPFKVHSLLVQWFQRMTASPGAKSDGVLPETVLSWPALFALDILPPFFRACFEAWAAFGGGVPPLVAWPLGSALVVGPSLWAPCPLSPVINCCWT